MSTVYLPEELARAFPQFHSFRPIHQNATGGVFAVYCPRHAANLVLKITRAVGPDPRHERRFAQEYKLLAENVSDRLVRVIQYGRSQIRIHQEGEVSHFWYTMPLCLGSVATHLSLLALPTRFALLDQMLEGLAFLHRLGIVHRDIKPANLFLASMSPLDVKIGDFGIAKALSTIGRPHAEPQEQTAMAGTPPYLAPERADPTYLTGDTDWRPSDEYAAGVTIYQVLSLGDLPVRIQSMRDWSDVRAAHLRRPLPPLAIPERPGARFPEVDRVIGRMMAISPKDRYGIASARHALEIACGADRLKQAGA